ncbi:putative F-box protein At3g23960 [Coffea arabica]|uniref:F-box protein At3g23960 n=1 Tax=Coffea arabica TaxID=13443 RepID=A0A6P6V947_COFAR|nr:putative F-box protein At3g23960 [Coffea arabica]
MKRIKGNLDTPISISEEILLQILQEIPAKSLMSFKCVSRHWCSMIEGQEFVDAFRVGSHKRGTKLLVRKSCSQDIMIDGRRKNYDFFLVNLQDKSVVPLAAPVILQTNQFILGQPVEGLVCCNNIIWNPTMNETITLPQRNPSSDLKKVIENMTIQAGKHSWSISSDYCLGFEVSIKKYKVFSITHVDVGMGLSTVSTENLSYAEVLTLGSNNFWKNTKCSLPQELCKIFGFVDNYCSINGIIYMIIRLRISSSVPEYRILSFDLSRENFQLLPLPGGGGGTGSYIHFTGEVGGRFALIHGAEGEKTWLLEECFQGGKWIVADTPWPECWRLNPEMIVT